MGSFQCAGNRYAFIAHRNCFDSQRARHLEARSDALQDQLDKVMTARFATRTAMSNHCCSGKRGADTMRLRVSFTAAGLSNGVHE